MCQPRTGLSKIDSLIVPIRDSNIPSFFLTTCSEFFKLESSLHPTFDFWLRFDEWSGGGGGGRGGGEVSQLCCVPAVSV
jgi:hypothetical protein